MASGKSGFSLCLLVTLIKEFKKRDKWTKKRQTRANLMEELCPQREHQGLGFWKENAHCPEANLFLRLVPYLLRPSGEEARARLHLQRASLNAC